MFTVQDTGRGLSASEHELMFARFSQASPRTHIDYGITEVSVDDYHGILIIDLSRWLGARAFHLTPSHRDARRRHRLRFDKRRWQHLLLLREGKKIECQIARGCAKRRSRHEYPNPVHSPE